FLLLVLPTLYGFVEEESYIYYPIILIGFSIIPQLLFSQKKERIAYHTSILYFLVLILIIDILLNSYNPVESIIFKKIDEFYFYYKLVPVVVFFFVYAAIYYLKNINTKFEQVVNEKNIQLDKHNEELKSTIAKLKQTQNQLVHSEKMAALGNLTSGISHEINNPLNYINGGIFFVEEVLEIIKTKKDKANLEYISELLYQSEDMISKGVKRASQIVNLLSVFSLQQKSEKQKIDLNELLNGTIFFISIKAHDKIKIIKEFNYSSEVSIFHDEIHQVFLNIFNNAIESILETKELKNPIIKISTNKIEINNSDFIHIEIFNSGKNIPEKDLLTIFEPFYSTKDTQDNPGLGLSIAYSNIKKHNGTIEVQNKKDGILVIVSLPL
ncbi:MAG: GHKL domain-containing protein, partial [Salinivirgaceae bacterium]|nr:GHKL domain-containing protein [Salinivirgaceae bacterium]